jgi:hypothetical protein
VDKWNRLPLALRNLRMRKALDFLGLIWHIRNFGETNPAEDEVAGGTHSDSLR